MTDKPTTSSAAEFALQALVAAGHVSQELVDKAMVLPGAPQPAHSGEPVAYYQPDDPSSSSAFSWPGSERNTAHNKPLFTAPQPVEREPLTQAKVVEAFCALPHQVQFITAFDQGVRFAERHHGIKGGQHD